MSTFKVSTKGLVEYDFPEDLWRRIVDDFEGRPPIKIQAMPEGSVVYKNEPVIQIQSMVDGFGELAAWFESKILQVWSTTERATQNRHWFKKMQNMVRRVDDTLTDEEVNLFAGLMLHDFGDRAGICSQESEELGYVHLYTFAGTDTVAGAYQAWKNANERAGVAVSVDALAHRIVQSFEFEGDCYRQMYDNAKDGEILSMVSDCYNFYYANENFILPLALDAANNKNGKILVTRPDSGDALEQVLWVCELAVKNGLYTEKNGFKYATTLKFIEGDGMTFTTMMSIMDTLIERGFAPFGWGLFGVGGGLRNLIKRDNLSAKYALCAVTNQDEGVLKASEVKGKATLPGPFKILRNNIALVNRKTIANEMEFPELENSMVEYFNGVRTEKPFSIGMDDNFDIIQNRIMIEFDNMPKNLRRDDESFPATDYIIKERDRILSIHKNNS